MSMDVSNAMEVDSGGEETSGGETILVVDDSPTAVQVLRFHLRTTGYEVLAASSAEDALEVARSSSPDLVLIDVMMPGMDGFDLTRELRRDPRTTGASIILLTGRSMPADKIEGLGAGADDYIVKPFDPPELLARVHGVLRRARDLRAQSPLTGLPGNGRIHEQLGRQIAKGRDFAVLHADLDHFKAYNDHYGFFRGDMVIKWTARMIQAVAADAGQETFVGHVGGDDFVVIASSEAAPLIAAEICARIDREAPSLYDDTDRERGYIETVNRKGVVERYPFVSISIGGSSTGNTRFRHPAEAVTLATEMKSLAKKSPGSTWALDARKAGSLSNPVPGVPTAGSRL